MKENQLIIQADKLVNPLLFNIDSRTRNYLRSLIEFYKKRKRLTPKQKNVLIEILVKHNMIDGNAGKRKELLG